MNARHPNSYPDRVLESMEPKLEALPLLSASEWRIFSALSRDNGPVTIRDIEARLSSMRGEPIPYGQILVLVQRLIKKGYAAQRPIKGSNAHQYWALYSYDDVLRRQAERWLADLTLGDRQTLLKLRALLEDFLSRPV